MDTKQLATQIMEIANTSEKSIKERRIEIQIKLIEFERDAKIQQLHRLTEENS